MHILSSRNKASHDRPLNEQIGKTVALVTPLVFLPSMRMWGRARELYLTGHICNPKLYSTSGQTRILQLLGLKIEADLTITIGIVTLLKTSPVTP